MRWSKIKVLMKKDLWLVLGNKRLFIPMTLTPLSLLVLTPLFIIYALKTGMIQSLSLPSSFMTNIPNNIVQDMGNLTEIEKIIYLFSNYVMAAMFLLMPLMICSWISSASMITEKENRTMETLLYAPLTKVEFFLGKILGSFIPSIIVSYLGLAIYGSIIYLLTYNLFGFYILQPFWIYIILLLLPTSLLFGVTANILASAKAKNVQEAQQFSIIITFPFMVLLVNQMMGKLYADTNFIIYLSIGFFIVDCLFIYLIAKKFSNENILKM